MTLQTEILERIRKMPIVSDLKSRRFFKDTTPETCHILEVFLSYILGEEIKVNSIEAQKHGYQRNGRERIADIDIDISGNISGMVEIQNWNGKVKELDFERWDGIRDAQRYMYGRKKRYVLVLFNIKNGKNKIWDGFRDKEMMVYAMKSEDYEDGMDKRAFPDIVNGIIILLNLKKLAERDDELGEISRDLLARDAKDIKNESVRKRVKEVFTKEEEKRMCIEEERMLKSLAKKLVKEQEKKIQKEQEKKYEKQLKENAKKLEESNKQLVDKEKKLEEKDNDYIKFMFFSLKATPEEISEGIKMPLDRVKAILAI